MSDMASKYRALGDKAKAMMFDESFQQYFYDAAKEFERLTAESKADAQARGGRSVFAVLRLLKHLDLGSGTRIKVHGMQGCQGMMPVFETREQAEEIYGEDVDLLQIEVGNDD